MSEFDGKLFGGRLYAGKLFGRRRSAPSSPGPDDPPMADARRRVDFSDDELIEIAMVLIMSGELNG